jgi:hypothetical protein
MLIFSYQIRVEYPLFENEPQRAQSSLRREPEEIKVKRGYICGFGITRDFIKIFNFNTFWGYLRHQDTS